MVEFRYNSRGDVSQPRYGAVNLPEPFDRPAYLTSVILLNSGLEVRVCGAVLDDPVIIKHRVRTTVVHSPKWGKHIPKIPTKEVLKEVLEMGTVNSFQRDFN